MPVRYSEADGGSVVRQHRVQDDLADVVRVRDRVARRREGAVRDAVDDHLRHAQRLAELVEVRHGLVGRIERCRVAEDAGALPHRIGRRCRDVRTAHLRLQAGALQGTRRPGAALVEHDEPVVLRGFRQPLRGDPRDRADAALPGAAGEEQQHALGRRHVVRGGDGQAERARHPAGVVERHGQGRAREARLSRARVRVRQLRTSPRTRVGHAPECGGQGEDQPGSQHLRAHGCIMRTSARSSHTPERGGRHGQRRSRTQPPPDFRYRSRTCRRS